MLPSQIRSFVLMVLSVSMLMSALGPWFQSQCSKTDPISHDLAQQHDAKTHSGLSPTGQHHPCPDDQEPISDEQQPCSIHITFCCSFDGRPAALLIRALHHSSWTSLDHWSLPRALTPLHETSIRSTMIRSISHPPYSVYHSSPQNQATLGIFLI